MGILGWQDIANLEISLYEFLLSEITDNSIQVLNDKGIAQDLQVVVGNKFDSNWILPIIQVYHDSNPTAQRLEIGSNRRDTRFLLIIDIRTNSDTNRMNIADWVTNTINEGFPFFEYTPNGSNPTKVQNGNVSFDFVSNNKVILGEDVSIYDKYRHRLSISCWISRH